MRGPSFFFFSFFSLSFGGGGGGGGVFFFFFSLFKTCLRTLRAPAAPSLSFSFFFFFSKEGVRVSPDASPNPSPLSSSPFSTSGTSRRAGTRLKSRSSLISPFPPLLPPSPLGEMETAAAGKNSFFFFFSPLPFSSPLSYVIKRSRLQTHFASRFLSLPPFFPPPPFLSFTERRNGSRRFPYQCQNAAPLSPSPPSFFHLQKKY